MLVAPLAAIGPPPPCLPLALSEPAPRLLLLPAAAPVLPPSAVSSNPLVGGGGNGGTLCPAAAMLWLLPRSTAGAAVMLMVYTKGILLLLLPPAAPAVAGETRGSTRWPGWLGSSSVTCSPAVNSTQQWAQGGTGWQCVVPCPGAACTVGGKLLCVLPRGSTHTMHAQVICTLTCSSTNKEHML
jgi:hypothetical protein